MEAVKSAATSPCHQHFPSRAHSGCAQQLLLEGAELLSACPDLMLGFVGGEKVEGVGLPQSTGADRNARCQPGAQHRAISQRCAGEESCWASFPAAAACLGLPILFPSSPRCWVLKYPRSRSPEAALAPLQSA